MSAIDQLSELLEKAGPYIGPKGGKWADAKHTIPWHGGDKTKQMRSKLDAMRAVTESKRKKLAETKADVASKKKKLAEIKAKTPEGMKARAEELKAKTKKVEAHTKKIDRGLAREDRKADKTEKSMSAIDQLNDHLTKAIPSEEADVTPEKARKILSDGEVGGKSLTDKQKGFFGAIAGKGSEKKVEKSMSKSALENLEAVVEDNGDTLVKGFMGYGHNIEWANKMAGSPFEVEALQCLKDSNECQAERRKMDKEYSMPWEKRRAMDPVDRAKMEKKNAKMYEKYDAKEQKIRTRMDEVEKKYLDWRIEQAKSMDKSEAETVDETLEKSDIPTGQPTGIKTGGEFSGNPEDGCNLAGMGKPAGSEQAPNPEADQDANGQVKGVPTPKTQDWSLEDNARRVFGYGTMKSTGPIEQDRAIAESNLRKGKADVHPYMTSKIHGNAEENIAQLSKGGSNELDPRNAIIAQDSLCKSCEKSHPAMLTACPHCGDGTIGREVMSKGNPSVILDDPRGAPLLRAPKQEDDILIKE